VQLNLFDDAQQFTDFVQRLGQLNALDLRTALAEIHRRWGFRFSLALTSTRSRQEPFHLLRNAVSFFGFASQVGVAAKVSRVQLWNNNPVGGTTNNMVLVELARGAGIAEDIAFTMDTVKSAGVVSLNASNAVNSSPVASLGQVIPDALAGALSGTIVQQFNVTAGEKIDLGGREDWVAILPPQTGLSIWGLTVNSTLYGFFKWAEAPQGVGVYP
jgi:hypothetical protein